MITADELDQLVAGVTRVQMVTYTDTGTVVDPLPTRQLDGGVTGDLFVLFDGDAEPCSVDLATVNITHLIGDPES